MILIKMNKLSCCKSLYKGRRGSISIISLFSVIIFALIFLLLIDLSRIFVARTMTKKSSDASSLAIAQDLLFFEKDRAIGTALEIAEQNNCDFGSITVTYDEVIVSNKKTVSFVLAGIFLKDSITVTSASRSKITYPWDERINLCKRYRFDYIK
ncbi:MAG: Tad domain-containing protein [Actinobacteria bacterium]|nr:Tad domain-containing protein [Actinomycetota bacterium]